ncbi:hypothetical protein JW707_00570 [Candidatus Woesearchaeota archaeon]|nr:hypothetical protein [Candidatus Woesearchaeota archaeon]
MKCFKCGRQAVASFRQIGSLCENHFLELIEKRVRKDMRTKRLIRKNDRILLINNESKEYHTGYYLLKRIIKDLPVKIETRKTSNLAASSKKHNKIIIPWSLDDEAEEFLNMVFSKKKPKKFSKKTIKLLKNVTEEEIEIFAKIKKFKCRKQAKPRIKKMLDELEKRYPGYKFSLLNSIKQMKELK